ncbi:MAG TPA: IS110 family transposase [Xanthomonadaceae bacterium]|nr:IS110 family transposase [Xanthomonadaceae bacterium]
MHAGIGIDVSKATLDVAIHGVAATRQFTNSVSGHRRLAAWLRKQTPRQVVLEATGGYERDALDVLSKAGLPVVRINPRQGRDFARATGQLAKTDRLDAGILAHMAHVMELTPYQPRADWQRQLAEWTQRRRHVVQMLVSERQRLARMNDPVLRKLMQAHVRSLVSTLVKLDRGIASQLAAQPALEPLRTLKGVGQGLLAILASQLPELGRIDGKAVAKLVGVAPMACDSGQMRGKRRTWGGRAEIRNALYMAALSAMRHEPRLRDFYQGLRARGKAAKVAIVAVMRKLLVMLNARMRDSLALNPV